MILCRVSAPQRSLHLLPQQRKASRPHQSYTQDSNTTTQLTGNNPRFKQDMKILVKCKIA